jgi:hypothetical protein
MTTQIIDLSQIDLTGGLRLNGEAFRAAHINGERLWPFGVDLLYTGGIGGASYLPDPAGVYGASTLAAFGEGVSAVLDEKNGPPVLGPELVTNGDFSAGSTGWFVGGSWSIAAGSASFSGGTTGNLQTNILSLALGTTYAVSFDVSSVSGTVVIRLGSGATSVATIPSGSTGRLTFRVAATSGTAFVVRAEVGATITIDNISVREVSGLTALQPSASLRPLLGRAPKAGRRNQLTWTEELDNPAWVKSAATVVPNAAIAPNGELTADALIPDTSNAVHKASISFPYLAVTGVGSLYVKSAGARYFGIGVASTSPARYAFFDFENINAFTRANNSTSDFPSVTVSDEGDGWYKITFTAPYLGGASTNVLRLYVLGSMPALVGGFPEASLAFVGDGASGVYFWGHQIDPDTITPYQRIGAATDITEAGVPSYPFVRFDLSDDRLDTVLPQAVTGDVVIAGRNGSVIAPHSYAANSTFQLGPTSYTGGTPGILRAIGDVVGWSILNKTLTAAERERLMRFYKRRGAKGLLVPGGPELVANAFNLQATDWSFGAAWSVVDGKLVRSAGQATGTSAQQVGRLSGINTTGKAYLFELGVEDRSGDFSVAINSPGTDSVNLPSGVGVLRIVAGVTASRSNISINAVGSSTITINFFSVRELRPEEEW